MGLLRRISALLIDRCHDDRFLEGLQWLVGALSKVLAMAMVMVILAMLVDLTFYLFQSILSGTRFLFVGITEIFGAFLSILIALELLENITAYLKKHILQIELVIGTSLIAVARKIIILDFEKVDGLDLVGLALAIAALSLSYWIVRRTNTQQSDPDRGEE